MQRMVTDAAQTRPSLPAAFEAGNASELVMSSELGLASQARLMLKRSEGDSAVAREHLTKLMASGARGLVSNWRGACRSFRPMKRPSTVSSHRHREAAGYRCSST